MGGGKGSFGTPREVVERCPYPDPENAETGLCGAAWQETSTEFAIGGVPELKCERGHQLHLGIDSGHTLTRQCPAFVIAIWDKFVAQSASRRLGLLFGADRWYCDEHGWLDFAETDQAGGQKPLPQLP